MVSTRNTTQSLFRNGILIGLAGGLSEVAVVGAYTALTGGDAAVVGRGIATAVGLTDASAWAGLGVHMGLAAALGVGLYAARRATNGSRGADGDVRFMLASLAAIWAVNFFVVLPLLSPGFVHILPYAVTLTSKLAFGLAAAGVMRVQGSPGRLLNRMTHRPASHHAFHPAG